MPQLDRLEDEEDLFFEEAYEKETDRLKRKWDEEMSLEEDEIDHTLSQLACIHSN